MAMGSQWNIWCLRHRARNLTSFRKILVRSHFKKECFAIKEQIDDKKSGWLDDWRSHHYSLKRFVFRRPTRNYLSQPPRPLASSQGHLCHPGHETQTKWSPPDRAAGGGCDETTWLEAFVWSYLISMWLKLFCCRYWLLGRFHMLVLLLLCSQHPPKRTTILATRPLLPSSGKSSRFVLF